MTLSSKDIEWLLRKRYCPPEYSVCFQIGNRTGIQDRNNSYRHLDAIAMGLYPSRGLPLYGIEIKVDRQDFKREIQNPEKSDAIAKYLDYFFVAYPADLKILELEIPPAWGLMAATPDGLRIVKAAEKINAAPLTREFVAALFRAMHVEDEYRAQKMIEEKVQAMELDFNRRVAIGADLRRAEHEHRIAFANEVINELGAAGFDWKSIRYRQGEFVRAVKSVMQYQDLSIDSVEEFCQKLESHATQIRRELRDIHGVTT